MLPPPLRPEEADRFWSKIIKTKECWLWIGYLSPDGYGHIEINGNPQNAHRVSYLMNKGDIPSGYCVMHSCDNPRCVNPDHLSVGTTADNMRDKCAKGRQSKGPTHWARVKPWLLARGDRSGARLHPERIVRGDKHHFHLHPELTGNGARFLPKEGAKNPNSKLTEDQVKLIRSLYAQGGTTQKQIAQQFGVKKSIIGHILTGVAWSHI